ncbi:MAG: DUF6788 family protein, partial [Chloroflexota bacterium]
RRCGKPSCHCAQEGDPGHGPLYSLTHAVGGKTATHIIPKGPAVERTLAQMAEYRRFRDLVRQLVAVSEQICQAQLPRRPTGRQPEDKKNGARRAAGRRGRGRA